MTRKFVFKRSETYSSREARNTLEDKFRHLFKGHVGFSSRETCQPIVGMPGYRLRVCQCTDCGPFFMKSLNVSIGDENVRKGEKMCDDVEWAPCLRGFSHFRAVRDPRDRSPGELRIAAGGWPLNLAKYQIVENINLP